MSKTKFVVTLFIFALFGLAFFVGPDIALVVNLHNRGVTEWPNVFSSYPVAEDGVVVVNPGAKENIRWGLLDYDRRVEDLVATYAGNAVQNKSHVIYFTEAEQDLHQMMIFTKSEGAQQFVSTWNGAFENNPVSVKIGQAETGGARIDLYDDVSQWTKALVTSQRFGALVSNGRIIPVYPDWSNSYTSWNQSGQMGFRTLDKLAYGEYVLYFFFSQDGKQWFTMQIPLSLQPTQKPMNQLLSEKPSGFGWHFGLTIPWAKSFTQSMSPYKIGEHLWTTSEFVQVMHIGSQQEVVVLDATEDLVQVQFLSGVDEATNKSVEWINMYWLTATKP